MTAALGLEEIGLNLLCSNYNHPYKVHSVISY